MTTTFRTITIAVCLLVTLAVGAGQTSRVPIRPPAVSDQFYPGDPVALSNAIEYFLADAIAPTAERPIAIVSPHAGYIYSGQICADAFKQAAGHKYDLIVLLGTNHTTGGFRSVSIYPGGGYQTPLGVAKIDETLAAELMAADSDFEFNESVHRREHSIEVMVPFVQKLFPGIKILPVILGTPDVELCTRFGTALAKVLRNRKPLIVASSDLAHYPAFDDAERVDHNTLQAITRLDVGALQDALNQPLKENLTNLSTCACGAAPVMAAIVASKALGATDVAIISYANSGHSSVGNRSRVVGYGALAFFADSKTITTFKPLAKESPADTPSKLTKQHKRNLLAFARKTITQYLESRTAPLPRGFDPELERTKGAFVTIKKHGQLRGCIGHMVDDLPLCQAIGNCALQAAFNDRRFQPVAADEIDDLEIEISVLTPYRLVGGYEQILIGRDGVLIEKDGHSAVYLPSVPVEQGWDRDEMLDHLCVKAGLPRRAWTKGTKFYTFQSIVFAESDLR